jgi:hypothetical protein
VEHEKEHLRPHIVQAKGAKGNVFMQESGYKEDEENVWHGCDAVAISQGLENEPVI